MVLAQNRMQHRILRARFKLTEDFVYSNLYNCDVLGRRLNRVFDNYTGLGERVDTFFAKDTAPCWASNHGARLMWS